MTKKTKSVSDKEYEQLGKKLVEVYESGYFKADKLAIYKTSFIKGVLAGFGGVIGATVVVALLLWLLPKFDEVPLVGRFTESLHSTIESGQPPAKN